MIDLFIGPQSSPRTMEALRRRYQQPPPRSHFGLLGLLIAVFLGYNAYQAKKQPEGLQINLGPNGLKIQNK